MNPSGKTIREDLARAKAAYAKNDELRVLFCLAQALKAFVLVKPFGPERTTIEGLFRDVFGSLARLPHVAMFAPKGLPYVKGQEQKLAGYVAALFKKVEAEIQRETLEAMRARKLRIDQFVIKGSKFLAEGNILEAQRNFRAAVEEFVDEKGLFPLIAGKLLEAGHHKASLEYVKRAIEEYPDNSRAYDFLMTALAGLKDFEAGEKLLRDVLKKTGDQSLLLANLARVLAKLEKWAEARDAADKALALDPNLAAAKSVSVLARKKLAPA
jgi:tetratricopeptide (TPR) repeat protein